MLTTWTRRLGTFLLIAALALAAACGGDDNADNGTNGGAPTAIEGVSTPASFPLTVQRSDGKELVVDEPVRRAVSLSPGATEIIYAIGAESVLVAVDRYANYPEAAASFEPKVDAFEPNVEAIAALEPDLVIVASNVGGIVEALDRLNIPVLFIDLDADVRTIEQVLGQIRLMGRLTGRDDQAIALVGELGERVRNVEEKVGGMNSADAPRVFHELDSELYSVAEDTFIGSLYRTLGVQNIAGDGGGSPYPQLSQEAIIAANPQIVVLGDEAFGVTVESVKSRPGWSAIAAVQDDRVYPIDPDIISRPGPRIVDALEELARLIYPEEFQ